MKILTRHTVGGYRSVMSIILSELEPPDLKAQALRSAFIWDDHVLGGEFWHRNWARLNRGEPMVKEAFKMLRAMSKERPKTVFSADARDHDRQFLKRVTQSRINRELQGRAA